MASKGPVRTLMQRWRERRLEILKAHLPPELLLEYRQLGVAIRAVRTKEIKLSPTEARCKLLAYPRNADLPVLSARDEIEAKMKLAKEIVSRQPLASHKAKLIEFLDTYGPTKRALIPTMTGIPAGSLSELLTGPEFERLDYGVWALKAHKKGKRK